MPTAAQLRDTALAVAATIEPDLLSGPAAARVVEDLAVAGKALASAQMFVALRVVKTDAWRGHGHGSAADWLASQCGVTVAEAHRQLGTAAKAKKLKKTKKAMDEGKLSPTRPTPSPTAPPQTPQLRMTCCRRLRTTPPRT